jgi:DNA-binding transcriptional ArsR family regulator
LKKEKEHMEKELEEIRELIVDRWTTIIGRFVGIDTENTEKNDRLWDLRALLVAFRDETEQAPQRLQPYYGGELPVSFQGRQRILSLLRERPMTFSDFLENTTMQPATLTVLLASLVESSQVVDDVTPEGQALFRLAEKGA